MEQKEDLLERLYILQSAGMIDEKVVQFCSDVLVLLYEEQGDYAQETMEIFVTHLAMAMQRTYKEECETSVDQTILESLRSEAVYSKAEHLLTQIMLLSKVSIPESEQQLLLLHLCNICTQRRGEHE